MKTLIQNGTLVLEDGPVRADLLIEGEKIAAIGSREEIAAAAGSLSPAAAGGLLSVRPEDGIRTIDAKGLIVLPGGIDPHTHFNIMTSVRSVDDFTSGTISAVFGGTTTIIDHMGFGPKGCNLHHQYEVYQEYTKGKCVADYGLHGVFQDIDDGILEETASMVEEGLSSFKMYLTYDYRQDDENALRILQRLGDLGGMTTVHCENHAILTYLREKFAREGKLSAKYHPLSRPPYCEAEAAGRMADLALTAGDAPLYVVHVSAKETAERIREARLRGQKVYGETCTQYLVLDDSVYEDPAEGLKYIMSPPIRAKGHQEPLWEALRDGTLQVTATDHCSFDYRGDKQIGREDFTICPNGAPGVELRMPVLFSEGVSKGRIDLKSFARVTSTNAAKLFGMYPEKGVLREGSDADIVLFDPDRKVKVTQQILHDNCDYTPYEGLELTGWPVMTLIRGTIVVDNERLHVKPGFGQFIRRGKSMYEL